MGFRTCALRSARSRGAQRAVPVGGTAGEVAALAGQWEGSYASAATGRSGSISFTLSAGSDSAFGDVIMIPRGWGRPLQAWNGQAAAGTDAPPRRAVVALRVGRGAGGRGGGPIAPPAHPQTGARAFPT